MKLTQVLIDGGIAYGNPEMEYPKKSDFLEIHGTDETVNGGEYWATVKKWHSGRLPFEDQEKFWYHPSIYQMFNADQLNTQNGLYSVDLDVTVVVQLKTVSDNWVDAFGNSIPECEMDNPVCEYRKALRIN